VVVPPHLKQEAHLVLQYGNDLPIPIPDLTVDEHGVSATLSFSRTPHHTVVPWSAVYVVASDDGRGVLYYEDIPRDVSVIASKGVAEIPHAAAAATTPRALHAVPLGDGGGAAEAATAALSVSPRRRRRPQLRLVK
jgi:stringent starvation protein B